MQFPKLILIALGISASFSICFAETIVGRWSDKVVPNMRQYDRTIEIVITDEGNTVLKSECNDGSSSARELKEKSEGIYELVGSHTGDKYRIIPSDGNLQLLDNDGLIRIARRIENRKK